MSAARTTSHVERKTTSVLGAVANNARQYGIVGALLVIVVAFEILTKGVLLKPNSFVSLIQQNAYVIILAIGMVMVIIATHIDLSVGSLVAFIGGVCALLMERQGVNWMLAIAACFIGGTAVTGGIGTIPGAVVGAFVMGLINQGLSIMGVDTAIVKTIKGLVLLLAVAVDIMSKRKKS